MTKINVKKLSTKWLRSHQLSHLENIQYQWIAATLRIEQVWVKLLYLLDPQPSILWTRSSFLMNQVPLVAFYSRQNYLILQYIMFHLMPPGDSGCYDRSTGKHCAFKWWQIWNTAKNWLRAWYGIMFLPLKMGQIPRSHRISNL